LSSTSKLNEPASNLDPLRIVFAGTPEFSATVLQSILAKGHLVSAVYCQPDRRVGRGKKLTFGPVKSLALENDIPVEQPIKFNQEADENGVTAVQRLASYSPDLMIVVAYGLILPQDVLSIPKFGCVNIHASLLPQWRGAAPIQRAIERGDNATGITIMQMDEGLDTGNSLSTHSCNLSTNETGSTLHNRLAEIGSRAINEFLDGMNKESGSPLFPGEHQDNQRANYANKLSKLEAEIDWRDAAAVVERRIRAFNSWPVCFTYVGKNRLRVWQSQVFHEVTDPDNVSNSKATDIQPGRLISFDKRGIRVECGDGKTLLLTRVQADGSRSMTAAELLNSKIQWFINHPVLGG